MKLMTIILLICITTLTKAQTVYESLISVEKSYAPLLGNEAASLAIAFLMKYDLGGGDTSFHVLVKVDQVTAEAVSYSLGLSLFSGNFIGGPGVSNGASYVFQKENGAILMGYEEFMDFYGGINRIYTYINSTKSYRGTRRNSLVAYQSKDIIFGGEYNPGELNINKVRYYIQIGESAYTISEPDFETISIKVRNMKDAWDSFKS